MLKENERFDQLIKEDFSIIQNDDVFSFSTDALLLGILQNLEQKILCWTYVQAMG